MSFARGPRRHGAAHYPEVPVSTCDVAIVGAGPVGATLALLLGGRGRRVDLFEARAAPFPLPRAVHLDHHAARILQSVGVMDELAASSEAMDAYEWRSAQGATLLRLEPDGPGSAGWPASIMFHQPNLERLLARRLDECGAITLRRGCEVTALSGHDDQVQVSVATPSDASGAGAATWVVGCDGVHSTTRRCMDVGWRDHGYFFDWLVVDVVADGAVGWRPLNIQVCDPRRPTTAVSGGRGRRRFEFMVLPDESPEALARPEQVWRLLAPWGMTPANAALERSAQYRFAARSAVRWRRDRLFLAGDAAHQMPPFAGQGLCAGLRDAANLAWKLDAVLAGSAPAALLDTYQRERDPQVAAEIDFSIELGRIICVSDPAAAALRDEEMAAAARVSGPLALPPAPPMGEGVFRSGDPGAGLPSPQGMVALDGRIGRFDDVSGAGGRWVLLGWQDDPRLALGGPNAAWLDEMGAVVTAVGPGSELRDVDGAYGKWFGELAAAAVLVRPDFAVYGAARRGGGPLAVDALVGHARATLGGGTGE
jgi:2-polyprenyl-6-methoxyphenol hydroxylase-like FAD-dependent oxidoreductase